MLKNFLIGTTLGLILTLTAVASDREDDVSRTQKAAQVFKEIMNTPDQGIPQDYWNGEMHRHHSRGREVRLHLRRQLRPGTGNLPHRTWLERADVCGD